jgi:prophage DNA circulation protein
MPWEDRILEAAYTSPGGTRFVFLYEDFSVSVDKKTTTFIFPDFDGAFIQDLGRAGRNYPFTLYFSGEDYDQQADAFLAALEEKGIGTLEHPRYGTKYVVPTGTINISESHVNGANQAVFGVTFSETITDLTIPAIAKNATDQIEAQTEKSASRTISGL